MAVCNMTVAEGTEIADGFQISHSFAFESVHFPIVVVARGFESADASGVAATASEKLLVQIFTMMATGHVLHDSMQLQ